MKKIYILFLSLYCQFVSSYIIKVSQLRNPETEQRVVLYSDMHFGPNFIIKKNKSQKKLILEKIDKVVNDETYVIITENIPKNFKSLKIKSSKSKKWLNSQPVIVDFLSDSNSRYSNIINGDQIRYLGNTVDNLDELDKMHFYNPFSNSLLDRLLLKFLERLDYGLKLNDSRSINDFRKMNNYERENFLKKFIIKMDLDYKKDINLAYEKLGNTINETLLDDLLPRNLLLVYNKLCQNIKFLYQNLNEESIEECLTSICDMEMLISIGMNCDKKNIILFAGMGSYR